LVLENWGIIFLGNTLAYRNEVRVVRAIRALIHGRVQGVFFRAYTRDRAHKLKLVGWVRNNRDGTVECQVQGPNLAIEKFIQFLHHGSPLARVDNVAITNVEVDPKLCDFKITY
jgi:acylphosphatase